MKALMRGLGVASLVMCLAGLSGCGTDNETDAVNAQSKLGAPPPPADNKGNTEVKGAPSSAAGRRPPEISPDLIKKAPAKK